MITALSSPYEETVHQASFFWEGKKIGESQDILYMVDITPSDANARDLNTRLSARRRRRQISMVIISRLEESIAQRNLLNALHVWIRRKIRIDVEEDGHIHRLAGIESLLFEAKKHWILLKYGATWPGVTLYVATPMMSSVDLFVAV